ncbi:MAG: 4-hydroxythreonine-4-phosphate dehydrogenase PdxA [Methyloceanibacter sp.]
MDRADKPLALTLGDPTGIGPDITLLAHQARMREPIPPFVLLGDPELLAARARALGLATALEIVGTPGAASEVFAKALPVLPIGVAGTVVPGHADPAAASAIQRSIERAVALVLAGDAGAVVTNPISKAALYRTGFAFPGHTEFLGQLAGLKPSDAVMMLVSGDLKVVPVTIHIPLKDVMTALTPALILQTLMTTVRDLKRYFGISQPRIAVTGLNPHAGEDGTLGREEIDIIAPAIEAARGKGLDVTGPHSADALFHAEARKTYDVAIAMYHDQALIPFKTLAFDTGVNVTLGLPFVRTSPDHGTAFALAGTGKASPRSLIEALRLADAMRARAGDAP